MTRKEKIDFILSKMPEDQKEAFVSEWREAKDRKGKAEVMKKYNVSLTEEEKKAIHAEDVSNEIPDEDLDKAAGGCCYKCNCNCIGCA